MNNALKIQAISSLGKALKHEIHGKSISSINIAKNQELNYQIVLCGQGEYTFTIDTDLNGVIAYRVGYVPVKMNTYEGIDDGRYIKLTPDDFPDPLFPLDENKITLTDGENLTLWICTEGECEQSVGEHKITVTFYKNSLAVGSSTVSVHAYDVSLPSQELLFTQWFHVDCIASVHGVEVFSEEHWSLIEKYMSLASLHGMNIVLTPVLTPPLDTEVGGERPTVQLVDIKKDEKGYTFDLSKLERYVKIATGCGICRFEINHFFTQWGAEHAPKVIVEQNGEKEKLFGWETDALNEDYAELLRALVPAIIKKLEGMGIPRKNMYFHVSDEPQKEQLEAYSKAFAILSPLVQGCNQIDALSNVEFYRAGVVKTPVVAISHIDHFFKDNIDELWCYYCCAQNHTVANRFIAMPSARGRIIGAQMWRHGIKGFLQWGYNFYYSQYSRVQHLDPYTVNDAMGAFPAGDAFSVYPYRDGAIPSLRLKVFKEAINDYRLLDLSHELQRQEMNKILDTLNGEELTFKNYTIDESFFEELTRQILEQNEAKNEGK